ncbi:MAG: LysR family transcriptional regulator [Bdellovibrionota bacterium]
MKALEDWTSASQPALSESILKFERSLGSKVFYRTRLGVKLTPFGRDALEKARSTLSNYSDLTQTDSARGSGSQPIRMGCHPVVGSYVFPKALSILSKEVQNCRFRIFHGSSATMQEMVQNGSVDVALVVNPRKVPDLIISEIAKDHVYVWKRGKNECPDRIICNLNLFQTQTILRKWKNSPRDIVESDNLELVTRLTEAGLGYGIIPERAVKLLKARLKKEDELPSYTDAVCIIYRPEFGKLDFENRLIQAIKKAF